MAGKYLKSLLSTVLCVQFLLISCDSNKPTGEEEVEVVTSDFEIQVETIDDAPQGFHALVGVTLNRSQHRIGGFDFMFGYEAASLNFQAAIPGVAHTECNWEYFNYRFGQPGDCGNECPSGMIEVIAIAETNNGPHHPDMTCTDNLAANGPDTLFVFDFIISNDTALECGFVPIRLFWTNCTDNSIAYHPSDDPLSVVQGISRQVFDDSELTTELTDNNSGFPTWTGMQDECIDTSDPNRPIPIRSTDFINGGIDVRCAEQIDMRGDLNLNGTKNEIVDVVIFSNYFVHGAGVFNINYNAQVAASDVNKNGVPLEVADLVYQTRILVGDNLPSPVLTPVSATLTYFAGVLSINTSVGAAYVVAEGQVNPTRLAIQMEMNYAFDGHDTHILVSKIEMGGYFEGDFIALDANIINVECATYDGAPIDLTIVGE